MHIASHDSNNSDSSIDKGKKYVLTAAFVVSACNRFSPFRRALFWTLVSICCRTDKAPSQLVHSAVYPVMVQIPKLK